MQEIILENLAKWFSDLDFTLTKKNDKFSLICEELNIKIENLSREEFIKAVTEQGINGVEKLFNLKVLGIDLRELLGLKKETPKQPKREEQEKPKNQEDWIREEVKKAFERGDLCKINEPKISKFDTEPYTVKEFPRFPWNDIICFC